MWRILVRGVKTVPMRPTFPSTLVREQSKRFPKMSQDNQSEDVLLKSPWPDVELPCTSFYNFLFKGSALSKQPSTKPAYIDGHTQKSITYGRLEPLTLQLAQGFRDKLGLAKGQTVLIFSPNCLIYPLLIWSVQCLGAIPTMANIGYQVEELVHQIKDSKASILCVGLPLLSIAKAAAKRTGIPFSRIVLTGEEDSDQFKSYKSLISEHSIQDFKPIEMSAEEVKEGIGFMCYSSGTSTVS